jgi:hypothetical protein
MQALHPMYLIVPPFLIGHPMTTSCQLFLGLRAVVAVCLFAISLLFGFPPAGHSQELTEAAVPEIRSSDLEQLDRKITPEENIKHQSGERQLVSALLFGTAASSSGMPDEVPWLTHEFELLLVETPNLARICVDFSNEGGTFRATYLMRLVTSSPRVRLKVDYPKDESLIGRGGTFVAYPATGEGAEVKDACDGKAVAILPDSEVDELVFPARVNVKSSAARRLFIKPWMWSNKRNWGLPSATSRPSRMGSMIENVRWISTTRLALRSGSSWQV